MQTFACAITSGMGPGNLNNEHDKKLVSILNHYLEVHGTCIVQITTADLKRVELNEVGFVASLERAEKRKRLRVLAVCQLEDATPSERELGVALVARVVYYPKGKRRQKGPSKITENILFSKKKFTVCEDEVGDVGIFYDKKRLCVGNKPDSLLAFLLKNNGRSYTKHEIASAVFGTDKVGNISELVRRINNTVATKTKDNVTQIIEKKNKSGYMTNL